MHGHGSDRIRKPALALAAVLLALVALVALVVIGPMGFGFSLDALFLPGLACGVAACLLCWLGRGAWVGGAVPLSIAAVVLAGPVTLFLLYFALLMGVGAVVALVGSWTDSIGPAGMDGVASQALVLLLGAALATGCFVAQAWALLRGLRPWSRE